MGYAVLRLPIDGWIAALAKRAIAFIWFMVMEFLQLSNRHRPRGREAMGKILRVRVSVQEVGA